MNEPLKRLQSVQRRITDACIEAGRDPDEVALLAVSKRHPAEKIAALYHLGLLAFGENLLSEARAKQPELAGMNLQWHYIGAIQSNKTRAIAEHFQWVQSVDRERILRRLSNQRAVTSGPLNICLQVNIDREPQKAGANPEDILPLAKLAQDLDNIKLRGLMAIPRMTKNTSEQHDSFRRVRMLFEALRKSGHGIDTLSMGMSSDMEIAIAEGSTMVRIGTDLLGERNN